MKKAFRRKKLFIYILVKCLLLINIGCGIDVFKQKEIMSNHEDMTNAEIINKDNLELNLKLVRKIINIIGGTFIIESGSTKGAKITVTLNQEIVTSNNDTIENLLANSKLSEKKSKNLSIVGECKSIQVKIEMDRPTGDDPNLKYTSPIVYGYKLKLTTGGETIEY